MTKLKERATGGALAMDEGWGGVPWMKMFIPYLLAYGLVLFFMDAIFWDDWILLNKNDVILETFRDAGSIFNWAGYFHVAMLKVGPPLYRMMTLILGYLCGVLLWKLLGTVKDLSSEERFWIALLFLVLPFNPAKFALINALYILCLFSFFVAWYLFVARRGLFFRSLSLAFFLFSFNTNSLLVFYLLPIVHAAWLFSEPKWKSVIRWGVRNALFIIAPVFFFWLKTRYFRPSGSYAGYNDISLKLMVVALLPLPVMAFGFYWTVKRLTGGWRAHRWILFVILGIFSLWLAVFPYLAAGKTQMFVGWNTRHQLLMPLGGALLSVGAGLFFGSLRRFCCTAAVASIITCVYFTATLAIDWWKQKEIINLLAQSQEVKAARTIVMVDRAEGFTFGGTYVFYVFNGWLKKAFGDETRFAVNEFDLESLAPMRIPAIYRQFCDTLHLAGNYNWSGPDLIVTIRYAGKRSFVRGDGLFKIATEKINSQKPDITQTRYDQK